MLPATNSWWSENRKYILITTTVTVLSGIYDLNMYIYTYICYRQILVIFWNDWCNSAFHEMPEIWCSCLHKLPKLMNLQINTLIGIQRNNALSIRSMYKGHDPSPTHTYTCTCTTHSRKGYLIIPNLLPSKRYGSPRKITYYILPVSWINLCIASFFLLIVILSYADSYSNKSHEMSVIVSFLISFIIICLAW